MRLCPLLPLLYAYADLAIAAELVRPGSTRNDACTSYLLSTICHKYSATMELRNRISQLKHIDVIIFDIL